MKEIEVIKKKTLAKTHDIFPNWTVERFRQKTSRYTYIMKWPLPMTKMINSGMTANVSTT